MATNLFALTVGCAKCHDHKYEPISQQDYYRLAAVLQPAFNPASWLQPKQRLLADLPPAARRNGSARTPRSMREPPG